VPILADVTAAHQHVEALPAPLWARHLLSDSPGEAAFARATIRQTCLAWQLPVLVEPAELVVSELISNAVRHGDGPTELVIMLRVHFLHLSVRDRSRRQPVHSRAVPGTAVGGRGLMLVDAVAAGWGVRTFADGKVVWTTLRRTGS
jgi:anti-sigma regulatory factor (Ser/Thr protein kinase)